jgi:hypothetical protein
MRRLALYHAGACAYSMVHGSDDEMYELHFKRRCQVLKLIYVTKNVMGFLWDIYKRLYQIDPRGLPAVPFKFNIPAIMIGNMNL